MAAWQPATSRCETRSEHRGSDPLDGPGRGDYHPYHRPLLSAPQRRFGHSHRRAPIGTPPFDLRSFIDRLREAGELAQQLFDRAASDEDFDAIVKEYTDDSYPGIYRLTNIDSPLVPESRKRVDMVFSFGDVAFNLEVGEVGLAVYHGGNSPYGWHVFKRLE